MDQEGYILYLKGELKESIKLNLMFIIVCLMSNVITFCILKFT